MIKFTILLRHQEGLTHAQFVDYHRNSHAPFFTAESYLQTIRPDEAKFPDLRGCEFIVSEEHLVRVEA